MCMETDETQLLALKAYIDLLILKNYSANTISVYRNWFTLFLLHFPNHKPGTIAKNEIIEFLVQYKNRNNISASVQNQLINSIKFFYENVLNRSAENYELPRAKKPFQLPTVFAEEEVKKIILAPDNLKHRCMLCLAYAGGLRVSEIVNLRLKDIDSKRMVISLRAAKGMKDRQVMLSQKLLELLRNYCKEYKPKEWLFEGQAGGQYSTRSIQEVIQQAKKKAGIKKKGGTDILSIKELLGHNSLRTTTIYLHVSNKNLSKIQSPLDKLL